MNELKLDRTKQAIEKYDMVQEKFSLMLDTIDFSITENAKKIERELKIVEEYDRLVGVAYGCDTADINSIDTCEKCIRAGVKNPVNPEDLSFVRKMVKQFA